MKNKILLLIVLLLSIGWLISLKYKDQTNFSLPKIQEEKKIVVKNVKTNNISEEELEDYIIGVVGAEMPASFNKEALKAQAVAARTYAVYKINHSNKNYDIVSDISNQSYQTKEELKNKWKDEFNYYYNKIKEAVLETKDEVMTYDDEVIIAYYFAMSNGYTEDASLVFKENKPYLKSADSSWEDNNLKNFSYTKVMSVLEFKNKMNVSEPIVISDVKRSDTNRVNSLKINNQEYSGTEIRKKLGLRSTDFEINIDKDVVITTKGYGHGVGLSQYGANLMADKGYNYEQILKHYYNGINITKL